MSDFWARRKAAVQEEARAETEARETALREAEEARLADRSDAEILTDLGLPEPELLEDAEQVRGFLAAAVPQRLKTRALRRLWRLNPVLANLDGLVEYGEDYTDSARVVENLQTAYSVGKGMLARFQEEIAADPVPVVAQTAEPITVDAATPDVPEPCGAEYETPPASEPDPIAMTAAGPLDEAPPHPATSRRMRFHFETGQDV